MLRLGFLSVFLTVLPVSAWAGHTLSECYQKALEQDPVFQSAQAQYRGERQSVPLAWSHLLPTLTGSVTRTGVHSGYSTLNDYHLGAEQLTLSQPIYHHDLWLSLLQSEHQRKRAAAQHAAAAQNLMVRMAQAYFEVLAQQDARLFAQAREHTFDQQLQQAQERFDAGMIAITDVLDTQARRDAASAAALAADNAVADAWAQLHELVPDVEELVPLSKEALSHVAPEPHTLEPWVARASTQHWGVVAAYETVAMQRKEVSRIRSGHLPALDLTLHYKRGNTTPPLDHRVSTRSAELALTVPLVAGGRVWFQTTQAQAGLDQANSEHRLAVRRAQTQAQKAFHDIDTQRQRLAALRQSVHSHEQAQEATQWAYEAGTRTMIDVLESKTNLLAAQRDLSQAHYDYYMAFLKLKESVGTLTPVDLEHISSWLGA